MDVVRVHRRDAAQLVERRLEAGFRIALPGVREGVAESQRRFALGGLQQVEVLGAGLGRLHRRFGAGQGLAVDLRQRDAERVIHPAGAAGEHVDELLGLRRQGEQGAGGEGQQGTIRNPHVRLLCL